MAHICSTAGAGPRCEAGSGSVPPDRRGFLPVLSAFQVSGLPGIRARSLALRIDPETRLFSLALLDADLQTLMVLGSYPDEEAVAAWRRLGLAAGLALAIEGPDGAVHVPYPQIGRVRLGPSRQRRRHGLLNGRRPRFLSRRKTGRFPLRPRVHREPEIAGGSET